MDEQDCNRFMTTENNITITMQDVDIVMALNPEFKQQILIAAESRRRTEVTQGIEKEATEKKNAKS